MHKSNWGLLVDVDYLSIGNDFTNGQGISLEVNLEATLAEVAGLYRIQRDAHYFDAIFGIRGYQWTQECLFSMAPKE